MLSTKISFPRKRFLILVFGPILGVVFSILPMPTVLDFGNHCATGHICRGFPIVANNEAEALMNYLFWIGVSLVFFGFILLVNKLAQATVSNGRLVCFVAIVSVAIGLCLALAGNYIPRSTTATTDCGNSGNECSGFPLISTAQNIPYTEYLDDEYYENIESIDHFCDEPSRIRCGSPRPQFSDKNNFILTNFILNTVFYSFITFGLAYVTSLRIKKRANENTRN